MKERIFEKQQDWNVHELLLPHVLGRSLFVYPEQGVVGADKSYKSNAEFWADVLGEKLSAGRIVTLEQFNLFEWIPRNPGLFHTDRAKYARDEAQHYIRTIERERYVGAIEEFTSAPPDHASAFRTATSSTEKSREVIYTPEGKQSMLEGGIGCIRLLPVEMKTGGIFYFMAATSSSAPDEGIPLLIEQALYIRLIDEIRTLGNVRGELIGQVKFIPRELRDLYSTTYRIPRLYIEVWGFRSSGGQHVQGEVSVAASFLSAYRGYPGIYASYVTFDPGYEGARDGATKWLREEYVEGLYNGELLTDFDQQAPAIAETLFSLDQVLTSPDLAQQIATLRTKYGKFDWSMLENATFSYHTYEEKIMVKNVVTGGEAHIHQAVGQGASVNHIEIKDLTIANSVDLRQLATQLSQLRTALAGLPESPERDVARGAIATAEIEANAGNRSGVGGALRALRPLGSKVLEIGQQIGVDVAVAAIKSVIGI